MGYRPEYLSEPKWRGYIPLERAITGILSLSPPVHAFERINPHLARDFAARRCRHDEPDDKVIRRLAREHDEEARAETERRRASKPTKPRRETETPEQRARRLAYLKDYGRRSRERRRLAQAGQTVSSLLRRLPIS